MKTCERYYDCRRRTEDQVANSTIEVIPTVTTTVHPSGRNETGYWVEVTPERMEDIAVRVEELRAPRRRKTKPLKLE